MEQQSHMGSTSIRMFLAAPLVAIGQTRGMHIPGMEAHYWSLAQCDEGWAHAERPYGAALSVSNLPDAGSLSSDHAGPEPRHSDTHEGSPLLRTADSPMGISASGRKLGCESW